MLKTLPHLLACQGDWDFREKLLTYLLLPQSQGSRSALVPLCDSELHQELRGLLVHAKTDLSNGIIDDEYFGELHVAIERAITLSKSACLSGKPLAPGSQKQTT